MPVGIKDIALQCGVSQPTVSRILNGRGAAHSPATVERVMRAARESGYVPNSVAKALARRRFGTVGLITGIRDNYSHLPAPLLAGIHDALANRNMHMTFARLPDETIASRDGLPKLLRESLCDGLLIDYTHFYPPQMLEVIREQHIPSVWINSKHEGECVLPDDEGGAYQATRHLIDLGHRRIVYEDHGYHASNRHCSRIDRYAGYERAMRRARLESDLECYSGPAAGRSEEDRWVRRLAQDDRPTAVLSYGGGEGPVMLAARTCGLSIPGDLSVMTFGDGEVRLGVRVTSMTVPWRAVGAAAVEMLLSRIENPRRTQKPRLVPFGEPTGETCARPRGAKT